MQIIAFRSRQETGALTVPAAALRRIAMTGASAGLGAALARQLAAPGVELHLCARNAARLATVAEACRAVGATVFTEALDLADPAAGPAWIRNVAAGGPIHLLVLNAGILSGRPASGEPEPLDGIETMLATNLAAPMLTATAALPAMRARGEGRIVLISSLSAISPMPDAPGYSATKAGLSAFGLALADDLASSGVGVTLIEPGHILTRQTDQQQGAIPLALEVEAAAARILAAVERGRSRVAFPLVPWLWVRITAVMPRRLRLWLNAGQRFWVDNNQG